MSELKGTPEAHCFAATVAEVIQPDWKEFEELAAGLPLQALAAFDSRYQDIDYRQKLISLQFDSEPREFDSAEVAATLNTMHQRQDLFVQGVIRGYCDRKGVPMADPDDVEAVGKILASIFMSGLDKICTYLNYSHRYQAEGQALYTTDQINHLPSTLLVLAARLSSFSFYELNDDSLEPALPQAEIDELIDGRLQQACQRIQNNQKIVVPKGASDVERMFGGAINCIRTLYYYGKEQGFKRHIAKFYLPIFNTEHIKEADYPTYDAYVVATHKDRLRQLAELFNGGIGSDFSYPGPDKAEKALRMADGYYDRTKNDDDTFINDLKYTTDTILSINATRQFVDGIANGTLKYSEIMQAMMHLHKQPLVPQEIPEFVVPDIGLDWEILPWELVMSGESDRPPMPDLDINKPEHPRQLDWGRIIRLRQHIVDWKGGYIARTVASEGMPSLSPDKQYYMAVLPQADGSEHAIADHPELGNGIYMWREETRHIRSIVGRNENLTWRTVLCHPKKIARMLGARVLYHSKHVEFNVLDYLTCPPEKISTRRYAVGKGAMQMARMAQKGSGNF